MTEAPRTQAQPTKAERHIHHGRTGAAWAGTTIALVAFILGAIGLVIGNWVIFWVAAALLVAALVVTVIMQKMGYGAD